MSHNFCVWIQGFQGLGWSECRIRCQLQGGAGKEKATGSVTLRGSLSVVL
uniref:Uncharacterized protein n=1 Tax=Faecalibaculum rodentium TaxID=1702221 RepID=A0A140DYU7_9FIRM|nr:hypothetical protein AALO17_26900 [Faecalibaculum rodentium]